MKKYPQEIVQFAQKTLLTWIRDNDLGKHSPITQAYGVVFNNEGEILICRGSDTASWQIPGGSPEENETIEQTLKREIKEETDILIKTIVPLGVQKVEYLEEPKRNTHYQARFMALVEKVLPQTLDPDPKIGKIWQRKFVPYQKITEYVKWGKTGEALFADAIKVWLSINSNVKPPHQKKTED